MHLLFASFICFILLLNEDYAKGDKCDNYKQNVPELAENALIDAIKEERRNFSLSDTIEYDGELAKQACQRIIDDSTPLQSESVFVNNWNETLKKAMMSNNNGMTRAAKKIGCHITLATSSGDGSHNVELYCLLKK